MSQLFRKGDRVTVSTALPKERRYGRLMDGDKGTVTFTAQGTVGIIHWDRGLSTRVGHDEVTVDPRDTPA